MQKTKRRNKREKVDKERYNENCNLAKHGFAVTSLNEYEIQLRIHKLSFFADQHYVSTFDVGADHNIGICAYEFAILSMAD